jgi:preprotein translocase subunit SecG
MIVKVLLVVHIMAAFSMIVLILLQRSEGGALGMGGGGGGFVTGRGAANFLTKLTGILGAIFFATSLTLGVFSQRPAPTSAVGAPVQSTSTPSPSTAPGEAAPATLPDIKLPKQKGQSEPAAPAQPALPQSK